MNINAKRIEDAIKEHWGKKCKEYVSTCVVCKVWREWELRKK